MQLGGYFDRLRRDLAVAAEAGGDEVRALAERLVAPLESAIRLILLEALSAAADEITRELAPGSVHLRLRGQDADFVVTPSSADAPVTDLRPATPGPPPDPGDGRDSAVSRINFRPPEQLKTRIEDAASREGLSVNAWLVRAAAAALEPDRRPSRADPTADRYTGWVG